MPLPLELQSVSERHWARFESTCQEKGLSIEVPQAELKILFALSEWAAQGCIKHPEWIDAAFLFSLSRVYGRDAYQPSIREALETVKDETQLLGALRRLRNYHMLRITWRDLVKQVEIGVILKELSALADVLIQEALYFLHKKLCQEENLNPVSIPSLLVLALGKLGGNELNFSSDVDLIFVYPNSASGIIDHPQGFYIKLGQRLINTLQRLTPEGFVFRVDMRLRPFGDSGALVLSQQDTIAYYVEQGRDWERYALMKARVISGSDRDKEGLLQALKGFVYRPYVDYAMQAAIRHMQSLIEREVKRQDMQDNIKLGPGGIREIEFLVQSTQLIRGGRTPAVQQESLLISLQELVKYNYLSPEIAETLQHAYVFLRKLENRLQMLYDQQTQNLPKSKLDQVRIAYAMGFDSWNDCLLAFNHETQQVKSIFKQLLRANDSVETSPLIKKEVSQHFTEKYLPNLSSEAAFRLKEVLPIVEQVAAQTKTPEKSLAVGLKLLESIVRRSTYISLLLENRRVLEPLLNLMVESPWLKELLCRYPALLEELVDTEGLVAPLEGDALWQALRQRLLSIPEEDLEKQLEALRHFKLVHLMRIAIFDLTERLPLMRVSDHLSDLASVLIRAVENVAWQGLTRRFSPPGLTNIESKGFAVVAYGKLGGLELAYQSDLDLVFLYESQAQGDAKPPADEFYIKLAQRLLHALQIKTYTGSLYEVDLRLRPSGNAGLLVSSIDAFNDYQLKEAWIWEHQALLRARILSKDTSLRQAFNETRKQVLCQKRDHKLLAQSVHDMREKMRQHQNINDLKHGPGGLIDIEFIVQYMALAYANEYPEVVAFTDNVRILDACARVGVMQRQHAVRLKEIYLEFRQVLHHALLRDVKPIDLSQQRREITDMWKMYIHGQ